MQFKIGDIVEDVEQGRTGIVTELYNENKNLIMTVNRTHWIMGPNDDFRLIRRLPRWEREVRS